MADHDAGPPGQPGHGGRPRQGPPQGPAARTQQAVVADKDPGRHARAPFGDQHPGMTPGGEKEVPFTSGAGAGGQSPGSLDGWPVPVEETEDLAHRVGARPGGRGYHANRVPSRSESSSATEPKRRSSQPRASRSAHVIRGAEFSFVKAVLGGPGSPRKASRRTRWGSGSEKRSSLRRAKSCSLGKNPSQRRRWRA